MNLSQAKPEELFSNEFVSLFNELNIQVTEEEVNQFIDVDTEGSSFFQVEILVEANSFFEESQPCVREEDHPSSEDENEDTTPQGPAVLSGVLEEHYKNSRKLQKELFSKEMQDSAGTSYYKLTSTFQTYTEILKKKHVSNRSS